MLDADLSLLLARGVGQFGGIDGLVAQLRAQHARGQQQRNQSGSGIFSLSGALLSSVMVLLELEAIDRVTRVCHDWRALYDDGLYKRLFFRRWPQRWARFEAYSSWRDACIAASSDKPSASISVGTDELTVADAGTDMIEEEAHEIGLGPDGGVDAASGPDQQVQVHHVGCGVGGAVDAASGPEEGMVQLADVGCGCGELTNATVGSGTNAGIVELSNTSCMTDN